MLQIKIIIALVSVIGVISGGMYIKHLIGQNALLEASVAAHQQALTNYAHDVNSRIEDYTIQTTVLQEAFEYATLEEGEFNQEVDSHDYEQLALHKPSELESVLNAAIASMWDEVRDITGYTAYKSAPKATETGSGESKAGRD